MPAIDLISGLLADLDTLTRVSEAGVLSRRERRIEPGETRLAAIVFLDLVGFTNLSRVLTSGQLTTLVDRAFRIYELTVLSHGGYWDARFGDAALYVFPGHPSFPPACEAALRAGLALIDRTRQIDQSVRLTGVQVDARVGVAFGEVTRQRVGGSERQMTVMGDTVNLAQRLEASAEPGTVQTTVRVLDSAGVGFSAEPRGQFTLKGFGTVQVLKVAGAHRPPVRLRGDFRRLTPLVGREQLLTKAVATVNGWLDAEPMPADTGPQHNKLLLVRGATAVGKSRFVYEAIERLRADRDVLHATAHCAELSSALSFAAEVASVAGLNRENLIERWQELCEHAGEKLGTDFAVARRGYLPFLAVLFDAQDVDTVGVRKADPKSFMLGVSLALRACIEMAALEARRAVVLVVEDVQWLGELEELLGFLLAETEAGQPLTIIATTRSATRDLSQFDAEVAVMDLAPLTVGQGEALIHALLPGVELPAAIERELHAKAIGIPYYYEEFARMLVRRGIVRLEGDRYLLSQAIVELAMPEDIQMLILGRLDQMEPELRDLTGRISVVGRTIPRDLLARMEEKLGILTHAELEAALEQLEEQHILALEAGGRWFFEHMLTQEAAYNALLASNRGLLHRLAAEVLEEDLVPGGADEADILPELSYHLREAGQNLEAHLRACQLLGLKAASGRFENWEQWEAFAADSWASYRSAVHISDLPESSHMLLSARGSRLVTQGRWKDAMPLYEQALDHARARDENRAVASLLSSLGSLLRVQGRIDEAREYHLDALTACREEGNAQLEGIALRNLGTLCREQGEQEEALRYFMAALQTARECSDRRNEALILDTLGMLYMDQWSAELSEQSFLQALAIARELRSPWGEGIILANLGLLNMKYFRMEQARDCLDRALGIAREVGDPRMEGEVLGKRANLLLRQKDIEGARPDLAQAEVLLTRVGNPFQLGFVHCQWAFFHLEADDPAAAAESLKLARGIADSLRVGGLSALAREIEKVATHLKLVEDGLVTVAGVPRPPLD